MPAMVGGNGAPFSRAGAVVQTGAGAAFPLLSGSGQVSTVTQLSASSSVALAGAGGLSVVVGGGTPLPGLTRKAWHGGPAYYSSLTGPGLLSNTAKFPFFEFYGNLGSSSDATAEALYVNGFIQVTGGTDLALVRGANLVAMTGWNTGAGTQEYAGTPGVEHLGYTGSDEVDMNNGPTWTSGTGGYDYQRTWYNHFSADGEARFANYGKGVMYWETDAQAAVFENGGDSASNTGASGHWTQHIEAADLYWYAGGWQSTGAMYNDGQTYLGRTAAQVPRSQNYGWMIDRHRALQSVGSYNITPLKPIWAFVEVGHPYTDAGSGYILPAQVRGAAWNAVIHDAAGIILFAHDFTGSYPTWLVGSSYAFASNVVDSSSGGGGAMYCVTGTATIGLAPHLDTSNWTVVNGGSAGLRSNQYVTGMLTALSTLLAEFQTFATILNTQTLLWTFSSSCETMLKAPGDGFIYIFAMQDINHTSGTDTFTLPSGVTGTTATFLDAGGGSATISGGTFSVTFAAECSYRIIKVAI